MSGIGFMFKLRGLTSFLLMSMRVTAGESFFPEKLSQSTPLNRHRERSTSMGISTRRA
jgi:hypothetical protein